MNELMIRIYPDPVLRKVSEEIREINEDVKQLIRDMFDIMKKEGGIGLAAPQVGISKRIIVISLDEKGLESLALINPTIEYLSEESIKFEEGCLSIPGIRADVVRSSKTVVKALSRSGRKVEIEADGLLARALQHEIDHLNGILFIDRLQPKEMKKIKKDIGLLANHTKVYNE